jgi:Tfp pilus assembly PilM family ATPase
MDFKKIFEAFPPPVFLSMPFSGMSISDSAIRLIKFNQKNKRLNIEKFAEKTLSPGIISGGQINNTQELINIVTEIKNSLKIDYVKVSLPEEKGYLFTGKLPKVPVSEVKSGVESKMEENVPVPPGELIFDYKVMENAEKDRLDIVVSSLPISVVDNYVEVMQGAGLKMLSLEIESQAVARALLKKDNQETVLLIHFGVGKVGLYVVVNRLVHFTSTVQLKSSGSDSLDQLCQEIKRLFSYWHSLKENLGREDRKISEIILSGENISEEISSYISTYNIVKVTQGNVWTNVLDIEESVPEINFSDSLKYAAAIGLALPSKYLI